MTAFLCWAPRRGELPAHGRRVVADNPQEAAEEYATAFGVTPVAGENECGGGDGDDAAPDLIVAVSEPTSTLGRQSQWRVGPHRRAAEVVP